MITLKTKEEIELMAEGGRRLRNIIKLLLPQIKSGITTKKIDDEADRLIREHEGEASFKRVKKYYWATCLPINEQIVHTPPSARIIKDGDLLTLDIGFYYQGFHTDYATTVVIGNQEDIVKKKFLAVGEKTLQKAINKARAGNYLGDVSNTIEQEIGRNEHFIIKSLTGHGIGRELHEEPFVPGFIEGEIDRTLRLKPGLTLAIEVIYSMGTSEMLYEKSGEWSVITADRSLSACFEHTIAITDKNTLILT